MTYSSARRIEHSLSEKGIGGSGGALEQLLGLPPESEPAAATNVHGGRHRTESLGASKLSTLCGAPLGDGNNSAEEALGGGALALLGSIALAALDGAPDSPKQSGIHPVARLSAGLRQPRNVQEEEHVEAIVELTVKAMINAAKADGRIDEREMRMVMGELDKNGVTQAQREYLLAEVRKPMSTQEIVRAVHTRQMAAQVYAASLLAIEVDTPAEKGYLQRLARDLNLDDRVVRQIRSTLGVPNGANGDSWRRPISIRIPLKRSRMVGNVGRSPYLPREENSEALAASAG
jgi:uncharacterized membrane protein YebE (DUF533 family)